MLAVLALWAAAPAIACLASAPCHSCCRTMMTDCEMATVGAAHSCCQLQSSDEALPPVRMIAPERLVGTASPLALGVIPDRNSFWGQDPGFFNTPPPRSLAGGSTILRI